AEASLDRPLGAVRAQVHENYIVAQTRDGLVIVDQHAAHERLVYEKLKAALANGGVATQGLLIPAIVTLDADDAELLQGSAQELADSGSFSKASAKAQSRSEPRRRCSARRTSKASSKTSPPNCALTARRER